MIQISTPTQAPNAPMESAAFRENGFSPEGSYAERVDDASPAISEEKNINSEARKKNKISVFARLLDGLTGKGKKGGPEVNRLKADEEEARIAEFDIFEGIEKAEISEKAEEIVVSAGQNSKNTQNSGLEQIFSEGESGSGGATALLSREMPAEQRFLRSIRGENGFSAEKELPGAENDSSGELIQAENSLSGSAAGNEEKNGGQTFSPGRHDLGTPEMPPRNGNRAGKAGQKAELASIQREDAAASQFQAVFRQDTADAAKSGGENSRLSELRGKKGRERFNIEVRDLRTGEEAASANRTDSGASNGGAGAISQAGMEIELPVDLRLDGSGEGVSGKTGSESLSFEDALARELRGGLSADIVRDAAVIVRNGGEGSIRLSLHPESLGNVKIRLEMAENKITGHIIVESSEALRAFERELPVLEKAFRDSGFSETTLDMSLAQDGGNSGAGEHRQEGDFPAFMPVMAASLYEAGTAGDLPLPAGMVFSAEPGRNPVNLLV